MRARERAAFIERVKVEMAGVGMLTGECPVSVGVERVRESGAELERLVREAEADLSKMRRRLKEARG